MHPYKTTIGLIFLMLLQGCASASIAKMDLSAPIKNEKVTPTESTLRDKLMPRAMRKAIWSGVPTEDDSYGEGFRDGCDTYTGIMGTGAFRFIPVKINPQRLVKDQWYLRGFQDASEFCTFRLDWETH